MTVVLLQRDGDEAPIEVTITTRDDERMVVVETMGKRIEAEVEWTDDVSGHLLVAGRIVPFALSRRGDTIEVWHAGRQRRLELVPRTARRAQGSAAAGTTGDLKAPMPGKILEIRHAAGAAFAVHDAIIVMESMKMEMTLSVPIAGRVREILCTEGELVEMGEMLARLDPEPVTVMESEESPS